MKKNQLLLFVLSMVFVAILSGCGATRTVPIPSFGEIPNLTGKTSEEMTAKFGEPDRQYSGEKNTIVSEYRWASQKNKIENALIGFWSAGIMSGNDSTYVDMLRCWFRKNVVIECRRFDDLMNANLPGMGESSNQAPSSIPTESKQQLQVAEKKQAPVAVESSAPVSKKTSKDAVTTIDTGGTISKTFTNKKVKTVRTKILAGTEISGMEVVDKKDNNITLKTAEGAEIKVVLKQVKNDTVVQLKTTDNPNKDIDFGKIYASCK